MTKRTPAALRREVAARARNLCEYCLSPEKFSNATFEVEHIFPVSKGGETVLLNLALACSGCNKYKSHRISAIDLQTGEMAALYNPRKDVWKKHFKWSEDFTEILGLTATGRATVNALKLNRKNLVNLRKLLGLFSERLPK